MCIDRRKVLNRSAQRADAAEQGLSSAAEAARSDGVEQQRTDQNTERNQINKLLSEEFLLLHELTHRINNEFASIIAVVSRMAQRTNHQEVKDSLAEVEHCIYSYAQVHRALGIPQQSHRMDVNLYLGELCRAISYSKLEGGGIELTFVESQKPLQLQPDRCWRLGMMIAELITNAARHAFDAGGGWISVELTTAGPFVECRVTDSGTLASDIRPGCGLKIVQALAKSLDGRLVRRCRAHGNASRIIFPALPTESYAASLASRPSNSGRRGPFSGTPTSAPLTSSK